MNKLKAYIIRTLGLKGSLKWAQRQLRKSPDAVAIMPNRNRDGVIDAAYSYECRPGYTKADVASTDWRISEWGTIDITDALKDWEAHTPGETLVDIKEAIVNVSCTEEDARAMAAGCIEPMPSEAELTSEWAERNADKRDGMDSARQAVREAGGIEERTD